MELQIKIGKLVLDLFGRKQLRADLKLLELILIFGILRLGSVRCSGEHNAGLAISRFAAGPLGEVTPYFRGLDHKRHFANVSTRQADPAPIPAGLFAGDTTLLAQGNRVSTF